MTQRSPSMKISIRRLLRSEFDEQSRQVKVCKTSAPVLTRHRRAVDPILARFCLLVELWGVLSASTGAGKLLARQPARSRLYPGQTASCGKPSLNAYV